MHTERQRKMYTERERERETKMYTELEQRKMYIDRVRLKAEQHACRERETETETDKE